MKLFVNLPVRDREAVDARVASAVSAGGKHAADEQEHGRMSTKGRCSGWMRPGCRSEGSPGSAPI